MPYLTFQSFDDDPVHVYLSLIYIYICMESDVIHPSSTFSLIRLIVHRGHGFMRPKHPRIAPSWWQLPHEMLRMIKGGEKAQRLDRLASRDVRGTV